MTLDGKVLLPWTMTRMTHLSRNLLIKKATAVGLNLYTYLHCCYGSIGHRKFGASATSRWRWVDSHVNTHRCARTRFWTRVIHATAQGHSASRIGEQLPLDAQSLAAANSRCQISVQLPIGKQAHAGKPHNSLRAHFVPIKFSIRKASLAIVPFWVLGIETWLEVLRRTQPHVQHTHI